MDKKLTCKMSDGTEWEAEEQGECDCIHNCGATIFAMTPINREPHKESIYAERDKESPIKREPREWWNVMWEGHSYPEVQSERQFKSFNEAQDWATEAIGPNSAVDEYEIIKVREVIDE